MAFRASRSPPRAFAAPAGTYAETRWGVVAESAAEATIRQRAVGSSPRAHESDVAQYKTQVLWERGKFHAMTRDLAAGLGGCVIGASGWETKVGYTRRVDVFGATCPATLCPSSPDTQ
jgi:hypothetical protein